jgi:hypothetical protein
MPSGGLVTRPPARPPARPLDFCRSPEQVGRRCCLVARAPGEGVRGPRRVQVGLSRPVRTDLARLRSPRLTTRWSTTRCGPRIRGHRRRPTGRGCHSSDCCRTTAEHRPGLQRAAATAAWRVPPHGGMGARPGARGQIDPCIVPTVWGPCLRYELAGTPVYTELPTPPDELELVRSADAAVLVAS